MKTIVLFLTLLFVAACGSGSATCNDSEDCPPHYTCDQSECRPQCTSQSECAADEWCPSYRGPLAFCELKPNE